MTARLIFDWTAPGDEASGQPFIRVVELDGEGVMITVRDSSPHVPMSARAILPADQRVILARALLAGTGVEFSGGPTT